MHRAWVRGPAWLLLFLLCQPFLILLHEALILLTGNLLDALTWTSVIQAIIRPFLASPVYAQLAAETLGGIDVRGIAIAGGLGEWFHTVFPSLFLSQDLVAPGALVSAVVGRNSTVLSLFVTFAVVEVAMILSGAMLVRAGLRGIRLLELVRHPTGQRLLGIGIGIQVEVQAIWSLFGLTLSGKPVRLEDTGIGVAFSLMLRVTPQQYSALMKLWLPIVIPLALLGFSLLAGWLLGKLIDRSERMLVKRALQPRQHQHRRFVLTQALLMGLAAPFATTTFAYGYLGLARTNVVSAPEPTEFASAAPEVVLDATPAPAAVPAAALPTVTTQPVTIPALASAAVMAAPTAANTPPPVASVTAPVVESSATPTVVLRSVTPAGAVAYTLVSTPVPTPAAATPTVLLPTPTPLPPPALPAKVQIERGEHGFRLNANGRHVTVTGMNYNVNYTGFPLETKLAMHRRDFRVMRDAGVNVVIGWGVYDRVTLDVAYEYGIGVIMPFELDPQGPFENENYRNELKDGFRTYVEAYRDHPALWGWNPGGDELLHRMDTEQRRTTDKLQAAADFLVELSGLAFSLDPNHVSFIKEPRDWYVPHLDVALKKVRSQPGQVDPSRYFVFGLNVYGSPDEVATAIRQARRNAENRMEVALVVGEFAPFGLPREDRARNLATMWDSLQATVRNGGFVYVFGPDQPNPQAPNPYDPLRLLVNEFSLVDNQDKPVDDSLAALAARWHKVHVAPPAP